MNNQPNPIPILKPHLGGTEQAYITAALESNWITTMGPNVLGFESDLESYLGNNSKVAVLNSGTAALHLALILLGVTRGDEVICQSLTFVASANPIVYQGAIPIFIDSEEDTWNMCPIHLEEAIKDRISKGKKPKAIVAVHSYGMPYKVDEITTISKRYEIPIIEDSAEALGSSYKGRKCGTFGDISILSFNGNKIVTTSGGGALVTKDIAIKNKAIFLANQAKDDAPYYKHSTIGYNYRLSNICAGIGRGQMEVLDHHIGLHREMNTFYKEIFKNIEGVTVFSEASKDIFSNHWLSCIRINPTKTKLTVEKIRKSLEKDTIESRLLWKPMHLQSVFKNTPYYGSGISETLFINGLCLPSGSNLTNEERNRINTVLREIN